VTEPPQNEGFVDQDQLGRFSAKREHNQHKMSIQYHILSLSKIITHYVHVLLIQKEFQAKTCFTGSLRVSGSDFSLVQCIPFPL
jgi:hypothetical protein